MARDDKKSALRKTLLERRDALSHDMIQACEAQMRRHIARIPAYAAAGTVGYYYAEGSEAPTRAMIQDSLSSGRRVCLPRTLEGGTLEFAEVRGPGDLAEGRFGIMEPSPSCDMCGAPDALVVPAVGITLAGERLGRGRGYYDRFLAGYGGASIALAFSVQVVRSVPLDEWDRRVSWVITEDGATEARAL